MASSDAQNDSTAPKPAKTPEERAVGWFLCKSLVSDEAKHNGPTHKHRRVLMELFALNLINGRFDCSVTMVAGTL